MPMPKPVCRTSLNSKRVQYEVRRTFLGRGIGMHVSARSKGSALETVATAEVTILKPLAVGGLRGIASKKSYNYSVLTIYFPWLSGCSLFFCIFLLLRVVLPFLFQSSLQLPPLSLYVYIYIYIYIYTHIHTYTYIYIYI